MASVRAMFAVCVNNKGFPASLEVGMLYRLIPDEEAGRLGYLRVVDESGGDYAYPSGRYFPLEIPTRLKRALRAVPVNQALRRTSTRVKASIGPRLSHGILNVPSLRSPRADRFLFAEPPSDMIPSMPHSIGIRPWDLPADRPIVCA